MKLSHADQNYSKIEREALAIVLVFTRSKQFMLGRRFTLQRDHRPLKNLFAPDEEISKTSSTRITRWAILLIGVNFRLKYTPGGPILHADGLIGLAFGDENDNDGVCFALYGIYFVQSELVNQSNVNERINTSKMSPKE